MEGTRVQIESMEERDALNIQFATSAEIQLCKAYEPPESISHIKNEGSQRLQQEEGREGS